MVPEFPLPQRSRTASGTYRGTFLLAVALSLAGCVRHPAPPAANGGQTSREVAAVIARIQTQEHAIRNLHIVNFKGEQYELDPTTKQWKLSLRTMQGETWYQGGGGGKYVSELRSEMPVQGSSEKGWESWELASFDGKIGYGITNAMSRVHLENSVVVGATTRPSMWKPHKQLFKLEGLPISGHMQPFCDGTAYTLGFFESFLRVEDKNEKNIVTVGDVLANLMKWHHPPTINNEILDGKQTVVLTDLAGNQYWFDPQCGYALMAARLPQTRGGNYRQLHITQLKEIAPGIWYPMAGTWERGPLGPMPATRIVFSVENATANGPDLPDTAFQLKEPPHAASLEPATLPS